MQQILLFESLEPEKYYLNDQLIYYYIYIEKPLIFFLLLGLLFLFMGAC